MYAGMSLLCASLPSSVGSAVVCSCVMGNGGSYSSGFINRSGRESVGDFSSTSFWVIVANLKAVQFLLRY